MFRLKNVLRCHYNAMLKGKVSGNRWKSYSYTGLNMYTRTKQLNGAITAITHKIDSSTDKIKAEQYYQRACLHHEAKSVDKAINDLKSAIHYDTNNHLYHHYLGLIYLRKHQYHEAIQECDFAIGLDKDKIDTYINRGCAYFYIHDYEKAFADFMYGIKKQPNNAIFRHDLGVIYLILNKYHLALENFALALKLGAASYAAHYQYASLLYSLGDYPLAIKHYHSAIRVNPSNIVAHVNLAITYLNSGSYEEAFRIANEVIDLNPQSPLAYSNRGYIHYCKNQYALAIQDLEKSILLNENRSSSYFYLGLVYIKNGSIEAAKKMLFHALTLFKAHSNSSVHTIIYIELLLHRIDPNHEFTIKHLEPLLDFIEKYNEVSTLQYNTILVILAAGYYAMQQPNQAAYYSMLILSSGHPKHIPYYFREEWFRVITQPDVAHKYRISSVNCDARSAKLDLLSCIQEINDTNLRQCALWQALLPNTMLGCIFYIKRLGTAATIFSGQLLRVVKILESEASLQLDETFLTCLTLLRSNHFIQFTNLIADLGKLDKTKFPNVYQVLSSNKIIVNDIPKTAIDVAMSIKAREYILNGFNQL